jgi:hypothetical protein
MAERDDRSEKESKTKIGVGSTQLERESRTRTQDQSQYAASAPQSDEPGYDDEYHDDDYGDYDERARRDARDIGESVRQTGRTARRAGGDLISSGCDLIGGIFIGIGEAISGRRSSGGGYGGSCVDDLGGACRGGSGQFNQPPQDGGGFNRPPQDGGGFNQPPGARASYQSSTQRYSSPRATRTSSRYELRRTRS